jgi:protein phosphatase 1 regulatory subunit 7
LEAIGFEYVSLVVGVVILNLSPIPFHQEIKNLDALANLEELWLGKNKIEKLQVLPFCLSMEFHSHLLSNQNLGSLKSLKILALQSNRITKIEGLNGLENLEDLYLSHNGIGRMEGLEHNVSVPAQPCVFWNLLSIFN